MDNPKNQNSNKRPHLSLSDDDSPPPFSNTNYPRFLIIHSTDKTKTVAQLSPFVLFKHIQSIAGEPKKVQKLRSGDVLVEVTRASHANNLLRSHTTHGISTITSPHRTLNSCRGVIRSTDLAGGTEAEIVDHLAPNVTDAHRITTRRDGRITETNTIILTFNSPTPPKEIKILHLNIKVAPYIPNPLRCYNCQLFGHSKTYCHKPKVCSHCSETGHEDAGCTNTPRCANCQGGHPAFSKDCPTWRQEKEVQQLKHTLNITYPEARKQLQTCTTPKPNKSYAQAATNTSTTSIQTQTHRPSGDDVQTYKIIIPTKFKTPLKPPTAATPICTQTPSSSSKPPTQPQASKPPTQPQASKPPTQPQASKQSSSSSKPEKNKNQKKCQIGPATQGRVQCDLHGGRIYGRPERSRPRTEVPLEERRLWKTSSCPLPQSPRHGEARVHFGHCF